MMEEDETDLVVRVGGDRYRTISLRFHQLTRSFPEERDDLMRDFLVTAQGEAARIEVMVRTWDGDGLDVFLAELAEGFRGWNGTRTWRSLEGDLTMAAEHAGSHVRLTWGLHDRLLDDEWRFELTTIHAPGEDMRRLAIEMHTFLESAPLS
ncbi:DUF6228 family protein [Streptomyces albidoflavus]|nr:DUF6228 family protein [Streptomyces sp. CNQ431]WSB18745.1 DUF6228 family protein [Streptomyces albidoflavus]WSB24124.1 DUF6228 family protein [Streptomyces albidoflavus]